MENYRSLYNAYVFFSDLVRDLNEKVKKYDSKDAALWFTRVSCHELIIVFNLKRKIIFNSIYLQALQYNVPGGKKNRGLATVLAYKTLVPNESELTPDNVRLAQYLGWCVEMVRMIFDIILCKQIENLKSLSRLSTMKAIKKRAQQQNTCRLFVQKLISCLSEAIKTHCENI